MKNTNMTNKIKIKKGDAVIVIAGKDAGKTGEVKKVIPEKSKVIVEGINLVKKHQKPNPQKNIAGGIISKEAGLHVSNVAIFNHQTKKADKVGYQFLEDGSKVRIFRSTKEQIDQV